MITWRVWLFFPYALQGAQDVVQVLLVQGAPVGGQERVRDGVGGEAERRPTPGRRKCWCAGPTEPGNVFVMFFQTPIYE
ncbi:hypothetical protein [Streptomyces sp. NPDC053427]|uniref:hypothetical protein n=1 Tax=Streptomyces sp. NPDC053427 TaxID=3365701 RepID=UPI0037D3FB42